MIDLAFDDAQQAIATAVSQFCADRCDADRVKAASGRFPGDLWSELAELGMLAIGTPEGEGGAIEMLAAMEVLGACVFPGPLVATFLAGQVLDVDARARVVMGEAIVAAGVAPLVPWAGDADLILEIANGDVFEAEVEGVVEGVETLGGEPWGRVRLQRGARCERGATGLVFADIAHAAYQAGAGRALVEAASAHARTRTQFGRSIGEFQAVAHPLADCTMDLAAAQTLARRAAFLFDESHDEARCAAITAKFSADAAALRAAYVAHQVFGANGITREGPVFHVSRRIRQAASSNSATRVEREALLAAFGMVAA